MVSYWSVINGRNYTNFKRNLAMMVIYLPVKVEFDRTPCFSVRKQKCGRTDGGRTHQTNRRVGYKKHLIESSASAKGMQC